MRFLTGILVVGTLLWGGYWVFGARGIENALAQWFDDRRGEGWVAEAATINTAGFPNRFDTSLVDLELADPDTGLAWRLPLLQILTLSYSPNHIILALPRTFSVSSPAERISITNAQMRGSVVFVPNTALTLDRSSFELSDVEISSSKAWQTKIATGQLATRQNPSVENGVDLYFDAKEIAPSQSLLSFLDPAQLLPNTWSGAVLDVSLGFDAAWDRFALEDRRPQPTFVSIKTAKADWGDVTLEMAGDLQVDATGWPSGTVNIRAKNWRSMLRIAQDTGLLPANMAPTVTRALELLATMAGNPKTLDAPLVFRNKTTFFAGLPIGPAPNLAIR